MGMGGGDYGNRLMGGEHGYGAPYISYGWEEEEEEHMMGEASYSNNLI